MIISVFADKLRMNRSVHPADGLFVTYRGYCVFVIILLLFLLLLLLLLLLLSVEQLVPEPSAFEVELNIEKLKNYKLPGTEQIPAELIRALLGQFVEGS
jgi:hypothetical protein